jgi:tetraacyldisaccharide 4'-kinase
LTGRLARPWLGPLTPLYALAARLRSAGLRLGLEPIERLAWPVVSVGSLSAGGAGKTPFVIAMAKLLTDHRLEVDVLSRGYGRQNGAAKRVEPNGSAQDFGDEPLLIAREAGVSVYVGARRVEAGRLAESLDAPPRIHLLDDGFQHRQLARDVDVVLVSSQDLEDWLLPAGNLREGPAALRRADVLAVEAGDVAAMSQLAARGLAADRPVWRYRRIMDVPHIENRTEVRVVAFCGIARPEQFFAGLTGAGLTLVASHAFADHHRFESADFALLDRLVQETGATALVTTAKDLVRLENKELSVPLYVSGLRIELEEPATAADWLRDGLRQSLSRARNRSAPR